MDKVSMSQTLNHAYSAIEAKCSEVNAPDYLITHIGYWKKGGWEDYLRILSTVPTDVRNKDVVDFGCKYGLFAPVLVMKGAKTVYCVDAEESYIEWGQKVVAEAVSEARFALTRNGLISLPSESVDYIFVNEVISHVNQGFLDSVYTEFSRILRPGGTLVIQDGNNGANHEVQKALPILWNQWENGPDGTHTDRDYVNKCFLSRRRDFIRNELPFGASEEVIDFLARNTSGLWGEGLRSTIREYLQTKNFVLRPYRYGTVPTNPTDGGYLMERAFVPKKVILDLAEHGIKSRQLLPKRLSVLKTYIKNKIKRRQTPSLFNLRSEGFSQGFTIIGEKTLS